MHSLLSINNYYYRRGGAEVVFLEQNRLLDEIGWRVIPFSMKHNQNLPCQWDKYFINEIEFGENYSLLEKIVRVPNVIYSLESKTKIRQLINEVNPEIAHAHNIYHHISPSIFSAIKRYDIPVVVTLHDLKLACPAYSMLNQGKVCEQCKGGKIHKVLANRCIKNSIVLSSIIYFETLVNRTLGSYSKYVDKFIVPSRFYIDKFVEWGWERDRFIHVPNFVDVNSHVPDKNIGRRFVYFGRLGAEKGLSTFIEAAAISGHPIRIIGTGPEEKRLKELAIENSVDVEFCGYLEGENLHKKIREARALVLPSEWYENAPMSVMESYALGRPVLGANIGGIPELVKEGKTGFIFESGNKTSLASCMDKVAILSDKAVVDMGYEGRRWVEKMFTADIYRERLLDVYSNLGVGR